MKTAKPLRVRAQLKVGAAVPLKPEPPDPCIVIVLLPPDPCGPAR
jgi:hypothetical protein